MTPLFPRRRKGQFERAADGSMTLMEHVRELRSRLFKASLAVLAGLLVGYYFAAQALTFLTDPYCRLVQLAPGEKCSFNITGPMDQFLLNLRIALYLGLLLASPIWLYQLWAFIAPGLHRRERRYTYTFAAVAAPLFFGGASLAYLVVAKSLHFFLGAGGDYNLTVGLNGYFDFVMNMMLLFGAGFEFPLILVMLNFAGLVTGRRLLGWWRSAIFLMFLFGAIVTPTPDPFAMTALATAMALLYFGAVGVAFLNDRRRRRKHDAGLGALADDDASPLSGAGDEAVEALNLAGEHLETLQPVQPATPIPTPRPVDHRYDDST